jgi:xanthine/uracil permease
MYGLLLHLYPQEYLRRHRAEMLQNFEDFERTSSKAELWLFLGKDLVVSLRSQFTKTLWAQTAIVVIVLAVLLAYTERHAVAREHPVEGFCCGYILGWFAGWFGERWQASSVSRVPNGIRSLPAQAMIVVSVLVLVIAVARVGSGAQNHVIWALCYGFLLAWIAGWIGNRWRLRP